MASGGQVATYKATATYMHVATPYTPSEAKPTKKGFLINHFIK
jgi:hypothetical protein